MALTFRIFSALVKFDIELTPHKNFKTLKSAVDLSSYRMEINGEINLTYP
jgi:hypothetical protein